MFRKQLPSLAPAFLVVGGLLLGLTAIADGPPGPALLVPYQGRLENNGVPVTNVDIDVQFSIYDVQNGGTALWSQVRTLSPESGAFSVVLGEQNALPDALRVANTVYLEISIDGTLIGNRSRVYPALQAITSNGAYNASYAILSGHAEFADGNDTGTFRIQKDGTESKITFDGETNDPGQIVHYESNNTAALWLDPSDDFAGNDSTDKVIIGDYELGVEKFFVNGAGDGYFDRNLHVSGTFRSQGAAQIDGALSLNTGVFGGYQPRDTGTVYTAGENGFVVARLFADINGARGYAGIYIDGNLQGSESVHYYTNSDANIKEATITLPVSKGSTYDVTNIGTSFTISVIVSWVPMAP